MNKKIAIMLSTLLILYPSVSRADLDMLSLVQDKIAEIQERLNLVVTQYTGLQVDLAKVVTDRGAFLQDLRNQAKAMVKDKAMALADNIKVGALSMPGISDKVTAGLYVTPELRGALAGQYLKRRSKQVDQFTDAMVEAEKNNNFIVENLAELFAQAVVSRKNIADEGTEGDGKASSAATDESVNAKTTTELTQKYIEISRRASERWINVLSYLASQERLMSSIQIARSKVDNLSDITGNLEDNVVDDAGVGLSDGASFIGPSGGASLLSIYNAGRSAYDNINNGNYGGVLGSFSGVVSDVTGEDGLGRMVGAGGNLINDTSGFASGLGSGNFSETFDNLMNGGDVLIGDVGGILQGSQQYGESRSERNDPNRGNNGDE